MMLIGKQLGNLEEVEIMQFLTKGQLISLSCVLAILYFPLECHETKASMSGPPRKLEHWTNEGTTHKGFCGQTSSLLLCISFCA